MSKFPRVIASSRLTRIRKQALGEVKLFTVFPELTIDKKHFESINVAFFGFEDDNEVFDFLVKKNHGLIIEKQTPCVTREENEMYQYIFDLGLKALKDELKRINHHAQQT